MLDSNDLKRLKFKEMNLEQMKNFALDVPGLISRDDILWLLARLEAAEKVCESLFRGDCDALLLREWQKAKGEIQ